MPSSSTVASDLDTVLRKPSLPGADTSSDHVAAEKVRMAFVWETADLRSILWARQLTGGEVLPVTAELLNERDGFQMVGIGGGRLVVQWTDIDTGQRWQAGITAAPDVVSGAASTLSDALVAREQTFESDAPDQSISLAGLQLHAVLQGSRGQGEGTMRSREQMIEAAGAQIVLKRVLFGAADGVIQLLLSTEGEIEPVVVDGRRGWAGEDEVGHVLVAIPLGSSEFPDLLLLTLSATSVQSTILTSFQLE